MSSKVFTASKCIVGIWRIGVSVHREACRVSHRHFHGGDSCLAEVKLSLGESFRLLKLSENPSPTDLRERYIDLAKAYHPDSGSASADSEKFTQLQEAYQVVHAHLGGQQEDIHEEEVDGDPMDDHIAPQHRNYLNFGGFGYGSPSQREKAYQKRRALKALKKASEHRVKRSTETPTDASALTARVKKSKSTNLIERMVEDMIQESMSEGDFDNLPGKGKPLPPKTQYCPFVDVDRHNLNQVLVNNGVVPEFVALEKEIRHLLSESKLKLYKERIQLGREPLNSYNREKWNRLLASFSDDISSINKTIDHFNLVVPLLPLQKIKLRPEKEIQKVLDRHRKYEEDRRELSALLNNLNDVDADHDKTFLWGLVSKVTGKIVNRIVARTMGKGQ